MRCASCGSSRFETDKFCRECGSLLEETAHSSRASAFRRRAPARAAVIAVVAVVTAGLAWAVLQRRDRDEPMAGEPPTEDVRTETRRQLSDLATLLSSLDRRVVIAEQAEPGSVADEGCPPELLEPTDDVTAGQQISELADRLLAEAYALREAVVIRAT